MVRRRALLVLPLILASCKDCDDKPKAVVEPAAPRATADAEAPKPVVDAGPPPDASAMIDEPFGDAGTSACRLVWGPAEQPFRGPATLDVVARDVRMVANEGGRPRVFTVPVPAIPAKGAPSFMPPRPATFFGMRWPPCELAGKFVYCPAPSGEITRATLGPSGPADLKVVGGAKVKGTARLAAAALGPEHSVVAWLEKRKTTEGEMFQAFIAADDKPAQRLSEEGAGATTMRFFPRQGGKAHLGEEATVVYLDTRTAMVPMHARPISWKDDNVVLASDVVLTVGGVPERGVDLEVAAVGPHAFAFVPMPRDTLQFGMAMIQVEHPPTTDVPVKWSLYPNGLDPAPMGAATARDGKTAWIVRTRPREAAVGSARILELGKVDAAGDFSTLGEIAPARSVTDILVTEDSLGAVWILYGDATITWLERRVCD